jgi:hypothetical protein
LGFDKRRITGHPDEAHITTRLVERHNLTLGLSWGRYTRLTNGFSKKVENLTAAVSLHFVYYNFARPHQTLTKRNGGRPMTPAMAAGKSNHVWTLEEIVRLLDGTLPD